VSSKWSKLYRKDTKSEPAVCATHAISFQVYVPQREYDILGNFQRYVNLHYNLFVIKPDEIPMNQKIPNIYI
jgi:hypothetical protein